MQFGNLLPKDMEYLYKLKKLHKSTVDTYMVSNSAFSLVCVIIEITLNVDEWCTFIT